MFERFTDRARRVVALAQEEARSLDHDAIGTEHLLLGLLAEDEGAASRVLAAPLSLADVRALVEARTGRGEHAPAEHIPFSPSAKDALEGARREAEELGQEHITPGHLLLAVLREGEGGACQVLAELGVDLDTARERAVALAGDEDPPPGLRSWGGGLDPMSERVARARARARAERDPVRESDPQGWEVLDCAGGAALRALAAARRHAVDALRGEIAPIDLVVGVLAAGDPAVREALDEAGADDPSPARVAPGYRDAGHSDGGDAGHSDGGDAGHSDGGDAVTVLSGEARRALSMAARLVTEEDACITPAHVLLTALEVLGPVRAAAAIARLGAEEAALRPALLRRTVTPPDRPSPGSAT